MSDSADSLRSILPPIYEKLLDASFDRPTIVESRATCSTCAMCEQGQGPQSVVRDFFKPDLKCCTFHPQLPNYLVGAVFSDPNPALEEGRRRLREKIKNRVGVTPRWIAPPRKFSVEMEAVRDTTFFGRSNALVCPYLDRQNGLCTVWKHRDSVCTTYFCKHTSGSQGHGFWAAFKEYVGYAELHLAKHLCETLDPTLNEPRAGRLQLTVEDLEDLPPKDAEYAHFWGKWLGREEEWYIACHAAAQAMTREKFAEVVDATAKAKRWRDEFERRYAEIHSTVLPSRLVRNPKMRVIPANDGASMIVTTYNRFDSFALESELYDVLRHFEPGKTLEETLAKLKEQGIELAPELLMALFTHAVLVAPDAEEAAGDTPEAVRAT